MAERIEIDEGLLAKLRDPTTLDGTFEVGSRRYTLVSPAGSGRKAVVWKVHDDYGREKAARFAIYDDYQDQPWEQEASRAAQLDSYPQFARFEHAGCVTILGRDFVCFVEEWVDGEPLAGFLRSSAGQVTSAFLLMYVKEVCSALSALLELGFMHDDLHAENVMIARTPAGHLGGQGWLVKIIDTGSLKPLKQAHERGDDDRHTEDHIQFVKHIAAIANTVGNRRPLAPRDRRFLESAEANLRNMLDPDWGLALREPEQILEQFELAFARSDGLTGSGHDDVLLDPFEYITAERMTSDELLVRVFAQTPWLDRVSGPDACLVSGPRGCGKSTVFRWLGLKAHLHEPAEQLDEYRVVGFYVGCGSDLQNRLGWISTKPLADKYRREIVHYFNLFVCREIVHTLALVVDSRGDIAERWGLAGPAQRKVCDFVRSHLGRQGRVVQGVSRLRQLVDAIEREMSWCHVAMLRGTPLAQTTSASFLGDLTELLSSAIPFLGDRTIAVLLDDYSTHRIPGSVQVVLNPIVWERRDSHVFKISSEKYGIAYHDELGATADVTREMVEVDFGSEYLGLYDSDQLKAARAFSQDLLDRRLRASGYAGSPDGLLGRSSWEAGSLARALQQKAGARRSEYHGLECIADLCSGDVAALLAVYRKIFQQGHVTKETTTLIPKHVQHEAIVSVSRQQLEAVGHHFPYGDQMHSIALHFGHLARQVLESCDLVVAGNFVPAQIPRIEVDQPRGLIMGSDHAPGTGSVSECSVVEVPERLSDDDLRLARELVRRSVFIELEPGTARHGNYPSLRWHFRRLLMPAFGAALSKTDAVKFTPSQFRHFLRSPKEACETEYRRRRKPTQATEQMILTEELP